jgi:hypothetical protein
MSKVKIEGNASGTGTFTIAAPNSNTDRTLTLPDEAGTVLTSASNTNFPAGSVLQVVQGENSTQVATTSSAYSATGTKASITPTSASSKILVIFSQNYFSTAAANFPKLRLYRDGSSIRAYEFTGYAGTSTLMAYVTGARLDSPATTSSIEYEIYFNSPTGSNVIANYTDANGTPVSTITLMEIAA